LKLREIVFQQERRILRKIDFAKSKQPA
jgi:hypothetical protein